MVCSGWTGLNDQHNNLPRFGDICCQIVNKVEQNVAIINPYIDIKFIMVVDAHIFLKQT